MSATRQIVEGEPTDFEDARLSPYWKEVNDLVRGKPGTSFNLGEFSASVASQIRAGRRPSLIPEGVEDRAAYMSEHFEVKTERVKSGDRQRRIIYLRFLG